jgi:hypothetical protein
MNVLKQVLVSLYSTKHIAEFHQQKLGKTFFYIFLVCLVSVLPMFYYFSTSTLNGLKSMDTAFKELPPFTIEDGTLHSEEKLPITLKDNEVTVIFDSTGTITTDNSSSGTTIFILQDSFAYAVTGQVQSFPYSMFGNGTFTKDDLLELFNSAESFVPIFIPITGLIILIVTFLIKLFQVTILAYIGMIFKNSFKKPLTYRNLWILSAYSLTLPIIFFAIMDSMQIIVPNGIIIYWFVAIIMLMLTIKELPKSE